MAASKCKPRPTLIPSIGCQVAHEVFWRVEAETKMRLVATVRLSREHGRGGNRRLEQHQLEA